MSARGLAFFRSWIQSNVDLRLNYGAPDERAHVLAAACRMSARKVDISLLEIEEEIGHLELALRRGLEQTLARVGSHSAITGER